MGTWGVGPFENDTAADWAFELEAAADLALIEGELNAVLRLGDAYLDADQACCAVAACEVVARLQGNWGLRDAYSEPADQWIDAYLATNAQPLPATLVHNARAAIDRIAQPPSELLELWQEEDPTEWLAALNDLKRRLAD